jgi:photosystem II stability/assembly factor-like uncharacterized protein
MKKNILLIFTLVLISADAISQNFWQRVSGADMTVVFALVNDTSGHIYAGTNSGVFRSTDNGDNWIKTDTGLTNNYVHALAISPNGYLFAGTIGGGVFLSTNNGDLWTERNDSLSNLFISSLATKDSGYIFAGTFGGSTDGGVFLSTDNGTTWTKTSSDVGTLITGLAIDDSGQVIAGNLTNSVFHSTDNGTNWVNLNLNASVRSVSVNNNRHIYAGTDYEGIYRSTDEGTNWMDINTGLPYASCAVYSIVFDSRGNIYAGTGPGVAGGGAGVFYSRDNGANWIELNTGLKNLHVFALAINTNGYIFAGTDDGIYRSVESTTGTREFALRYPSSYNLKQNFPNPFNPSTVISYTLPINCYVTLKIHDMLGKEVETLINQRQGAGDHSVTFNAKNLPSGVYFYRLQAGSYTDTKKLLLLK